MTKSENSTTTGSFHKNWHTTDKYFLNPSNSPYNNYIGEKKNNNNYKSRNKIKIKRTSLSRKGSKRNFKSYDINYENQNNSDSDFSFNFCFNITTNIEKDNFNNSSITSGGRPIQKDRKFNNNNIQNNYPFVSGYKPN